jgi:hypothetical protein
VQVPASATGLVEVVDEGKAADPPAPASEPLVVPFPVLLFGLDDQKFYNILDGKLVAVPDPFANADTKLEDVKEINAHEELRKLFKELMEQYFSPNLQKEVGEELNKRVDMLLKAGAVLNRKNKARLKEAYTAIKDVLSDAGEEDAPETDGSGAAAGASLGSSTDGQAVTPFPAEKYFSEGIEVTSGKPLGVPMTVRGMLAVKPKIQPINDNQRRLAELAAQIHLVASKL